MGWWRRIGDSPPTDDDMLCTGPLETPCPPCGDGQARMGQPADVPLVGPPPMD